MVVIDLPKGSYVPDIRMRTQVAPAATPPRLLGRDSRSIVVLPFLNLGGDAARDYFVDGLSEELTTILAQVPDLRVIARTSAFSLRGRSGDVRSIGRTLHVRTLVEGSVRWSGTRIRVTIQMVDCNDGYHFFAESFDVEEGEMLALQSEIAQTICDAIVPRLGDRGSLLSRPRRVDPEAYRLYLRARYHWNRRTLADFEKAIDYSQKAIAIQPDYAPPYACIADSCWFTLLDMLAPGGEPLKRGKHAAARAMELDPELAEAHCAYAVSCLMDNWQVEAFGEHLRRAIRLKPSSSTAHYLYACYHAIREEADGMLSEMQLALQCDPLSVMVNRAMVLALLQARQPDRALAQARETIELDPSFYGSHLYLAWTHMALGQHQLASEALERARQLGGNAPVMQGYLAACKAQLGETREAELILCQLLEPTQPGYVPPLVVAAALVALDRTEKALDYLERAVEERCGSIVHIHVDPFFLPLHGIPRFDAICRSMNLI
ncbi:MAG: hypothetical protein ACLGXA_16480 [Acidobacteriota bacterium]